MNTRKLRKISFSLAGVVLALLSSNLQAAAPDKVEAAIQRGVKYLLDKQNAKGHWEESDMMPTSSAGNTINGGQWGGGTALCTYAILASGKSPLDPNMAKAVDWLRKAPMTGHYAIGLRANVWLYVPSTEENKQAILKDYKLLKSGMSQNRDKNFGFYDYQPGGDRIDLSCSQYGVLGLWAVSKKLENKDNDVWGKIEAAWQGQQSADGGWSYTGKSGSDVNIRMTAAGLATLFITQDFVHYDDGVEPNSNTAYRAYLERGLKWISSNFQTLLTEGQPHQLYGLYGIERVGVASGYKYFGNIDWFQGGADFLLSHQNKDGSWNIKGGENQEVETAFAILFLTRGRAPVVMNKLQYSITLPGSDKVREGNWNQRPRDVANATRWVADKTERTLNWQIINLDVATIDDLHDSAILYISGNQALGFTDSQKALLKQYITEGGMIIGCADNNKPEFSKSFRDLGKQLFPKDYEFAPLTEKSELPILTGELYPAANWKRKPRIEVLSNRARIMMALVPNDDFGRILQKRDQNRNEVFEFFADAFLYSVDKVDARFKGQTHVVRKDAAVTPGSSVKVARLSYNGKWNPEPGGWDRLAAIMNNSDKVKLDLATVELGKDSLKDFKIAHLTGTDKFTLTEDQRKAIKDFVTGGGLLVIDSCGGYGDFDASVQGEVSKIFPNEASQIAEPLKKDHAIFTAGAIKQPEPRYRTYALSKLGGAATRFRLSALSFNNKIGVIYSPDDLSVGLVGMSIDGIIGLDPENATLVMRRIINLKKDGKI